MKRYLLLLAVVLFLAGTAQAQNVLLNPPDVQGQLGQCTYAGTYYSPYAFTPSTAIRGYTSSPPYDPCTIAAPGRVGHSSYSFSASYGGCEWQVVIEFDLQGLAGVTQNNFQSATLKGLEHFGYFNDNPLVGGVDSLLDKAATPLTTRNGATMDVALYDLCDAEEGGTPTSDDFDCTRGSAITTFDIPEGPFPPSQQGDCNDTMVLPDVNVTSQIFHDLFDGDQDPSWAGFLFKEPGMVEVSSLHKGGHTRTNREPVNGGNDFLVALFDLDTPTLEITTEEPSEEDLDFGDAPDPLDETPGEYPTLLANDGARHIILAGFHLGAGVDAEDDGQPNANATGDDTSTNDDEDGVIFTTSLVQGQSAFVTVTASLPPGFDGQGLLNAWIDFNIDGDWNDVGEQIVTNQALAAGANVLGFPVPAGAAPGNTFARFRFSSQGGLQPSDAEVPASDGEVEDYQVTIETVPEPGGVDFGDAPDPTYPTLFASNGARHDIVQGLNLGVKIDGEPDGQPDLSALGDDSGADLADDEDGLVFTTPLLRTQTANVTVIASAAGSLDAWIDFNGNGSWEAGEQIFTGQALGAGLNALSFPVPAAAALGDTFARFRISSDGGLAPTGGATDGEVEDYLVTIGDPIPPQSPDIDYGDAPDPTYPTLFASDGARHLIDGVLFLGASVDREIDAQPNAAATGDDTNLDDEDGVIFTTALDLGFVARVRVIASAPGLLDAWLDFNSDGDWNDGGEQIFSSQPLVAGPNQLGFLVPVTAVTDSTFARFRFSSLQGGLAPTGEAPDGEVEDYQVTITIREDLPPREGVDTDDDGIPDDEEEECGPDANGDRIPDKTQCHVASFKTSRGQCVTLEMPGAQGLCFKKVQDRWTLLPLPPNPPSWVSLPFGLLTFKISGISAGNCTTVTFHSSSVPTGQVPKTYWKYGPTPSIPFPHWYDFSFNGRTGAEFIDENTIVLHFCDGERGDSDLTANGEILDPGGPSHIGERRELYFPHVTNLGGGFNVDDTAFAGEDTTDIGIINKAPYAVTGTITFYREDGAVATDTKTIPSSPTNPFPSVETIEGVQPITVPGNGKLTILPEQFPSNAATAIVVVDGDVVGYAQFTSPAGKRYSAPATTLLTSIMTAPFLRISEVTGEGWRTGFGIFNPGDGAVIVQFIDDTLAGVPDEFTLDPRASRFLWVENPEEGVRNIQATGAIAAVEVFEYLPATSETDMAAILLGNQNASDLCVPAILFGAGEATSIGVGNPPGSGSATVNALGYNAALNETMVSLGTLSAGEMKSAYLTTTFPPDTLWARITGDVVQGLGSYFVDQQHQPPAPADAEKIATVNLNNLKFRDGCFGIAFSAAGTPTFALVNPGLADADVIAFAYDDTGTTVASSNGTITIGGQMTFGLTDLFGAADLTGAASIRIVSIESEEELCGLQVIPVDTRWQGLPILQ